MKLPEHHWSKLHLAFTCFWALMIVPTLLWWKDSILWVALMSIWANIAAHWAAYQGSRAEEAQNGG